jgi:hypothetical protein
LDSGGQVIQQYELHYEHWIGDAEFATKSGHRVGTRIPLRTRIPLGRSYTLLGLEGGAQYTNFTLFAVSKAGELFVADCNNHRVQVFRVSDGTFLRQIGGEKCSGNGQFNMPLDVALSPDETELLVVDLNNHRIQVFRALDGQYLRGWGSQGSADGQLDHPQSVVVTGSGEVVVADTFNHRVCVFDLDGTFRRSIGSQGSGPGQFNHPFLTALSSSSSSQELCVRQSSENRVQFFR